SRRAGLPRPCLGTRRQRGLRRDEARPDRLRCGNGEVAGLIECVPNFSEGRDRRVVDAIVNAIAGTPGVLLLAHESDTDHNRSVVTFAAEPAPVVEAALRGVAEAARHIDLRRHDGVHPRIGAADVIPFVPLQGSRLEDAIDVAHATGGAIWRRLNVPVYFYEAAALRPEY